MIRIGDVIRSLRTNSLYLGAAFLPDGQGLDVRRLNPKGRGHGGAGRLGHRDFVLVGRNWTALRGQGWEWEGVGNWRVYDNEN